MRLQAFRIRKAWYMLRGNTNGTIVGVESSAGQTVIPAAYKTQISSLNQPKPFCSNVARQPMLIAGLFLETHRQRLL